MPAWLSALFEILKFTVPALIVYFVVRGLFKEFLQGQQQIRLLEMQQQRTDTTLPMRLQAYERLSLFCERIGVPNLLLRLRTEDMQAGALRLAMLMAVQQEFEHNLTQQVYVSEALWDIIQLARTQTTDLIVTAAENINPEDPAEQLVKALFAESERRNVTPLLTAQKAIKKEAGLLFGGA